MSNAAKAGHRRLRASALAATVLVGGGLTACSSAGNPAAGTAPSNAGSAQPVSVTNVTLHIGDQAGAGSQALLTAAGLIGKLPFKADWSDFTSGPPMLQAMGSGSVDIGDVGDAPPIFAAAAGSQIAVVGALKGSPDATALLVPQNSPVRSVAQLKGKSIAVAQGSSSNYHILATLTKAGLSVKDVTLDYLQPADALAAFSSGHVAAWDVWTPFIEQAESQYHARVLTNGADVGNTYSFVVASRAALGDPARAAAIRDYLQLLDEAYAWAARHQSAWAGTWAKASGLPLPVMVQAVRDDQTAPAGITPAVISSEQNVANAFTSAGLIPGKVDFANFAVSTFNDITGGTS
jgi:sulfonate transport system substrate-binding protein